MGRLSMGILMGVVGVMMTGWGAAGADQTARIVAYFSSWSIYARQYFVTDIPADKLTHINYAFANVSEEGECVLGDPWADTQFPYPGESEGPGLLGNFHQLLLLKERYPHLQTLISIGGWTWSGRFSDVALTAESRQKFAASCTAFMKQYGFDGLDIDWEYPAGGGNTGNIERPEDPANFVLLMAEVRRQLDAQGEADGRHYLLTIATGAGERHIQNIDWPAVHPFLDWINVMAYDFNGSWSAVTGFNAPLYAEPDSPTGESADAAMQGYLAAGIPADKLVLGVPFYGRGWKEVADVNDGLHQPFGDIPGDGGAFSYHDLTTGFLKALQRHWSAEARVPWLYHPAVGLMISYDDAESLRYKAEYVREHGFGGIMIWELAHDDQDYTLLTAVYAALR